MNTVSVCLAKSQTGCEGKAIGIKPPIHFPQATIIAFRVLEIKQHVGFF